MFEWHTGEDDEEFEDLDELIAQRDAAPKRSYKRPLSCVVVLIGLCLVGTLLTRLVSNEADRAIESAESEIQNSLDFVFESSEEGDVELFTALISGRDHTWTTAQQQRVLGAGLLDRSDFGMMLAEPWPSITDSEISADLMAAVVTTTLNYLTDDGLSAEYQLPTVFRRGDTRWLFAPPTADFWGPTQIYEGDWFTMQYPLRDEEIVLRLAASFETSIASWCEANRLNCTPLKADLIRITFSSNPAHASLEPIDQIRIKTRSSSMILPILPTPSLIGIPANEPAFDAYLTAYSEQFLLPTMEVMADYTCCNHAVFFDALVERQMADLGLQEPLVIDYQLLLDHNITLSDSADLGWEINESGQGGSLQKQAAHAIIEFMLASDPNLTIHDMQREIGPAWYGFREWSIELLELNEPFDGFGEAWGGTNSSQTVTNGTQYLRRYLTAKAQQAQPHPTNLPDTKLAVACTNQEGTTDIWQVTVQDERWTPLFSTAAPTLNLFPLPQQNGFIAKPSNATTVSQSLLWRDGVLLDLTDFNLDYNGVADPTGQRLLMRYRNSAEMTEGDLNDLLLVDVDTCSAESCPTREVVGVPVWSPTGSHMLIQRFGGASLMTADGSRLRFFDASNNLSRSLYWLDDDTYIWQNSYKALVSSDITLDHVTPIITIDEIVEALPADRQPLYYFSNVLAHPASEEIIFVNAFDNIAPPTWQTFIVNQVDGGLEWLPALENIVLDDISESGRFLTGVLLTPNETASAKQLNPRAFIIYDTQTNHISRYPVTDFTQSRLVTDDGTEWFMLFENGTTHLIEPLSNTHHRILAPQNTCSSAVLLGK